MTRIVFLDTETTGLEPDADVWEVGMIVRDREHYADDVEVRMLVGHDADKCYRLPEPFRSDHRTRWIASEAVPPATAAQSVWEWTTGAHIVGAVPNFDTERLARLLRAYGYEPGWHYQLIDVESLAVGWLWGFAAGADHMAGTGRRPVDAALALPWDSDALSRAVCVDPGQYERHTALGDARWARAIYDRITGGRP